MSYTDIWVHLTFLCFFRKLTTEYGLWNTLMVDHGTEWALILYIQNMSNHRNDPSWRPYIQTSSCQVCSKLVFNLIFRHRIVL